MLAVSTWVAVLLILFAFGAVALLFLVGIRQRPELEIPPRTVPEPPPLPRIYLRLFVIGNVGLFGVGLTGALTDTRWLLYVGLGIYVACFVARLWLRIAQVRRRKRNTREHL